MSMTAQDWQQMEAKLHRPKRRKPPDPMPYIAALVILVGLSILIVAFYSITHAYRHLPDRPHANALSNARA